MARFKEGMAIAKEAGEQTVVAELCFTVAACYTPLGEYSKALVEIQLGTAIPRSSGSKRGWYGCA